MRIFISLDLEGLSNITSFEQINGGAFGKEAALCDLDAVIEGAREGGACQITVNDGHENGDSLPRVVAGANAVVRGCGSPFSMMQGVELKDCARSYDAAMFVGYHTAWGRPGVLSHTYFEKSVKAVRLDGRLAGEFEINAALAACFGVPACFISGDDFTCLSALEFCPGITALEVKKAFGRFSALCPSDAQARLKEGARLSLQSRTFCMAAVPRRVSVEYFDGRVLEYDGDYVEVFLKMIDDMRKAESMASPAAPPCV